MQTSYSYLDIVGRHTVVLKKENAVQELNAPFQVNVLTYYFNLPKLTRFLFGQAKVVLTGTLPPFS